jgi:hypothetical protein
MESHSFLYGAYHNVDKTTQQQKYKYFETIPELNKSIDSPVMLR